MLAGHHAARLFLVVAGLQVGAYSLAAQCGGGLNSPDAPYCPDCPPPCYAVSVSPDSSPIQVVATQTNRATYVVTNEGNTTDSYAMTCSSSGNATCVSVTPTSWLLGAAQSKTVYVDFTAGSVGTSGVVYLRASNIRASDYGSYLISNGAGSVTPDGGAVAAVANATKNIQRFTVQNPSTSSNTYTLAVSCTGTATACTLSSTSLSVPAGAAGFADVSYTTGDLGATGSMTLTATLITDSTAKDSGWVSINASIAAGPAPAVSLAPYSAGYTLAANGMSYAHRLPAFGSMGGARTLMLTYNSTAVRPVSLVTVDVSNPTTPYPNTYQVQVQLASSGAYLQLMNGSTSAYYTAGTTTTTRIVAAVDAKANGLTTGWYPVNVIVASIYAAGRTATASSRLLVNDQTASAFGGGVGLAGAPRLYSMPGSYSLLLVDGSGPMSYFDRTCATCAFTSSAGESGVLAVYTDPTLGSLYRLTSLDGGLWDFRTDGRPLRHFVLASIRNLTFAWTDTLLTSVTDASGRGFTLTYTSGKLRSMTDAAGRATWVKIVNGRLAKVTEPGSPENGPGDSLSYDANSFLIQLNDRAGGIWTYGYNALNQLSSVTGPAAVDYTGALVRPTIGLATQDVIVWQPSTAGTSAAAPKANVKPDTVMGSTTDALSNVTKVALDRFGLATKVVNAVGEVTMITRDTLGNATRIQEPNGHTVTRTYSGYLVGAASDNTTGQSLTYSYYPTNQLQTITGGPARLDYYYHDGTQGPSGTLRMIYAGNTAAPGYGPWGGTIVSRHFLNAYGQDTLVIDGGDHRTRTVYATAAAGGNALQFIDPKGHVTSYHYNAYGLVDTTTLVTGAKSVVSYDAVNRVTTSMNELGYVTQYFYSRLGLTRIQDPKGQVYKFDLNAWGLTVARYDLGDTTKVDSLKYDAGGNLRTVLTRRGDAVTVTYDPLGRPLTRSGPDFPQESFTYGLNGAWVVAANANGRDSIAFDQAGRPTFASQRMPDGTTIYQMTYTYDSHGRLVSRSAPAGGTVARWVYNANLGTLDTLCGAGTCAAFKRDAELKADTIVYSPGQSGTWSHVQSFDSLHLVTADSFSVSQLQDDFGGPWTYDSLGNLRAAQPGSLFVGSTHYGYDAAGQLVNACTINIYLRCGSEYGIGGGVPYRYDQVRNRTDSLANAVIGPGNRMQRFKGYAFSYDQNGALGAKAGVGASDSWNKRDTTTLGWNARGQLTRVEHWPAGGAHTVTTFAYDALGRRVTKTVNGVSTWFVYDGNQVVMDLDASSRATIAEYSFFPDVQNLFAMRTPSWTGVAIKDPVVHSLLGLAAAQGGVEIKRYGMPTSPWGEVPSDTGTVVRFRMGGQEYDQETGLYHLGARYYDPQLGRFISEDPVGVAGGLNLYAYAGNDPVNGRDPTGLEMTLESGGGGGMCVDAIPWYYVTYESGRVTGVTFLGWQIVNGPYPCSGVGGDGGALGGGGGGGAGGSAAASTPTGNLCTVSTLAGNITVDASIAASAQAFLNYAVQQGAQIRVESSFRTTGRQREIFVMRYVMGLGTKPAAPPGTSNHEAGFALDIYVSDASQPIVTAAANLFGFRELPGDPGHFDWRFGYGPYANYPEARDANQAQAAGGSVPKCGP